MDTAHSGPGWIGFDLDGTLAVYTEWEGPDRIGNPIPTTIALVKRLLKTGIKLKIFTARVCSNQPEGIADIARAAIKAWCLQHIGVELEITSEKDWHMIEYYDDRAIAVEFNTGRILWQEEEADPQQELTMGQRDY